ncbi:TonB-dependent receptor [Phascolarctobacterium faecium]|uniref:TonB-dependent receptor n=1 Tax=Phascolarctobacterium faecium TaxID=33025 RepID=UPI00402978EE
MNEKKKFLAMAVLCAVASVGFVLPASAEETMQHDLDEVIVEADRDALPGGYIISKSKNGILGEGSIMNIPFTKTSFSNKTIEKFNDPTAPLTSVLINTPSVRSSSYGLYNDFSIRGIHTTGYALYVNGVPGMFTQSTIPTNFAERIEVNAGPNMGIEGTTLNESAGGMVNMVSKKAADEPINRITQIFSGKSTYGQIIDIGQRFGKNKSWGLRINAENISGNTSVDDEELTNRDIFINLDHRDENSSSNLFAGYRQSKIKNPRGAFQLGNDVTQMPSAPKNTLNYGYDGQEAALDTWMVTLNHEQKIGKEVVAFFNGGYSRYDLYKNITWRAVDPYIITDNDGTFTAHSDRDGGFPMDSYYLQTGLKGKLTTGALTHNLAGTVDRMWKYGYSQYSNGGTSMVDTPNAGNIYEGRYDGKIPALDINHNGFYRSSRTNYWGWTLADNIEIGKANLLLGLHGHHAETLSYGKSGVKADATSPTYGIMYKPTDKLSLYTSHSESFSAGSVIGKDYANEGSILDPAKTKQNEIGIKYKMGQLLTSLSAFEITKESQKVQYQSGIAKPFLTNNGENEYKGIEFSINGKVSDKWTLMGGLMYLNAEQKKTKTGNLDGIAVNGVAKWNAVLTAEYTPDTKTSVWGRGIYTGTAKINNEKFTVPSSLVFDLGISHKAKLGTTPITISATCYNVLNKDYWIPQGGYSNGNIAIGTPRTFMLSAQFDL